MVNRLTKDSWQLLSMPIFFIRAMLGPPVEVCSEISYVNLTSIFGAKNNRAH